MPKPTYELDGARQLRKTLRAAGDDLSDLKAANASAAGIAADGARRNVPTRSGNLAATIRSAGTKTAGIVRVGNNSKVRYANVIHWGWGRRHIPANPFASKGAQQTEPTWRPVYERFIEQLLDQIKGK